MNFRAVELNVDFMVVVQAIFETSKQSSNGSALIQKIRQMLDLDWEVVVHHFYREVNTYADTLVNIGCSLDFDILFYENCLSQLSSYYLLTC
jgi:hypothetical protein